MNTGASCSCNAIWLNVPHIKSCDSVLLLPCSALHLCSSSMAGEDGRGHRSCSTVAVILVLCTFAQSLTCFSLRGLSENVKRHKVVKEATVMEVRTGSILFNGKALDSQLESASAAATGNRVLNIDLDQSDGTGMFLLSNYLLICCCISCKQGIMSSINFASWHLYSQKGCWSRHHSLRMPWPKRRHGGAWNLTCTVVKTRWSWKLWDPELLTYS